MSNFSLPGTPGEGWGGGVRLAFLKKTSGIAIEASPLPALPRSAREGRRNMRLPGSCAHRPRIAAASSSTSGTMRRSEMLKKTYTSLPLTLLAVVARVGICVWCGLRHVETGVGIIIGVFAALFFALRLASLVDWPIPLDPPVSSASNAQHS